MFPASLSPLQRMGEYDVICHNCCSSAAELLDRSISQHSDIRNANDPRPNPGVSDNKSYPGACCTGSAGVAREQQQHSPSFITGTSYMQMLPLRQPPFHAHLQTPFVGMCFVDFRYCCASGSRSESESDWPSAPRGSHCPACKAENIGHSRPSPCLACKAESMGYSRPARMNPAAPVFKPNGSGTTTTQQQQQRQESLSEKSWSSPTPRSSSYKASESSQASSPIPVPTAPAPWKPDTRNLGAKRPVQKTDPASSGPAPGSPLPNPFPEPPCPGEANGTTKDCSKNEHPAKDNASSLSKDNTLVAASGTSQTATSPTSHPAQTTYPSPPSSASANTNSEILLEELKKAVGIKTPPRPKTPPSWCTTTMSSDPKPPNRHPINPIPTTKPLGPRRNRRARKMGPKRGVCFTVAAGNAAAKRRARREKLESGCRVSPDTFWNMMMVPGWNGGVPHR